MKNFHGIIFAYNADKDLYELTNHRTVAAVPFCGRYRLIDFSLSAMANAGIHNVGVIMQRDYQSLLDHLSSGKAWDMSRKQGGLTMLPPFGLPEFHGGNYVGTIEALNAVSSYIQRIAEENIVLMMGHLCANIDLTAAMEQHLASDADITAICSDRENNAAQYRYVMGKDGYVSDVLFQRSDKNSIPTLECYIIRKDVLLRMMDQCRASNEYRFHYNAVAQFLRSGGKMGVYIHKGYAKMITSVNSYFDTSMDMLKSDVRHDIFPMNRPIRTRAVEEVSTYYGENAISRNSLIADNCIIEGRVENCIIFSGARIAKSASLKNCIVMKDCTVAEGVTLNNVIVDKRVTFLPDTVLTGSEKLPIIVPRDSVL